MQKRYVILGVLVSLAACGKPDMGNFKPGVVDACRTMPAFIAKTGLGGQVAIDTQQRGYTGLRLLQPQTGQALQHPTWDDAGHVGAFARDRDGNIYVAPAPEVSLAENPPALQNRLYKIDSKTGEMAFWLALPAENAPSASNPFGVMGLYYDCDTNSLYASSVAGSKPQQIAGRIFRIDIASQQVVDQLDGVDAIGVGVFNGANNKRFYFGSARSPDVYSLPLDVKGNFTEALKHEFSLANLPGGNSTSVRKFDFSPNRDGSYRMQAKELEFGFRLPAENNPSKRVYLFSYDPATDAWVFKESGLEEGG